MYTIYRVSMADIDYEYYSTLSVAEQAAENHHVLDIDADVTYNITSIVIYENIKERETHKAQVKKQGLIDIALSKLTDNEKEILGLSPTNTEKLESLSQPQQGETVTKGQDTIAGATKTPASCGDCGSKNVRFSAIPDRSLCKACKGTNIRVDVEALEKADS